MNRLASKPQPRSTTPRIVAKLDLSDELQRNLHGFFQRMHTGRWPTLRTLALRQTPDGALIVTPPPHSPQWSIFPASWLMSAPDTAISGVQSRLQGA